MKHTEQANMLVSTLVLILLIELLLFGGLGFAVPLSVLIYYLFLAWLHKDSGTLTDFFTTPLLIIILLISLCFALFDNFALKFFNTILLISLILLHLSVSFGVNIEEKYSVKWFLKIFPIGLMMPFQNMNKALIPLKEEMIQNESRHTTLSIIKKILIGCLLGIPLIFIAVFLLMRSDAAFEGIIDWLMRQINFDFTWLIKHLLSYALLFFPFMGFLYGLTHQAQKKQTTESLGPPKRPLKIDFTISLTIVILLSSVYMLYIFSQFTYFFSAFEGILPTGYTYAEYARRGFFEMLPLTGLNLGVIALLTLLTSGKNGKKQSICLKSATTFILVFNLLILVTALAKMGMYMDIYGLTLKRVFVTWIIVLGVISFLLIGFKIYKEHFNLTKYLFISFCVLYLGLNYSNVDHLIGKYNLHLYKTKQIDTVDSFYDLNLSSVESYIEIAQLHPELEAKYYIYTHYQNLIQEEKDWRENNISHYLAVKKWKTYFK